MEHGLIPVDTTGAVSSEGVRDVEINGFNDEYHLDVVATSWGYNRSQDSWWGPAWRWRWPHGNGTQERRDDLEKTFGGTDRRFCMMYTISEPGDAGYYKPAVDGDPEIVDGWRSMAQDLVSMNMGDTIIRPNPEHNLKDTLPRYPHDENGTDLPIDEAGQQYADAFARCVSVMNGVQGADFDFLYSPVGTFHSDRMIIEEGYPTLSSLWPAGEDPPIVCPSYYDTESNGGPSDEEWATMTDAEKEAAAQQQWEQNDRPRMEDYRNFADRMGADMALVEWGVKTAEGKNARGDNPWFIHLMIDWARNNGLVFEHMWTLYHPVSDNRSTVWHDGEPYPDLERSWFAWKEEVLEDIDGGGVTPTPDPPTVGGYSLPQRGEQDWGITINDIIDKIESDVEALAQFYGTQVGPSYPSPSMGQVNWHIPLLDAIDQIESDVNILANAAGVSDVGGYTRPTEGQTDWNVPLDEAISQIDQDLNNLGG